MKKAYFQYYETFEIVVQKFKTAEQREHFRNVIITYGFYGTEPTDLNELEDMAWVVIKELIDQQLNRRKAIDTRKAEKQQTETRQTENTETSENTNTEESATEQTDFVEFPNNSQVEIKAETNEQPKPKQKGFAKPTLEEVQAYIKQNGYKVNAEQFWTYYEANGWKVGRNPMKSWERSVQSWNARDGNRTGTMWQNGSADTNTEAYENYFN